MDAERPAIGSLYRPDPNSPRVAVVAPTHCRNGHRLGPNMVSVRWGRCDCGKGRTDGHYNWRCNACGDIQYSDEHDDDSKLYRT